MDEDRAITFDDVSALRESERTDVSGALLFAASLKPALCTYSVQSSGRAICESQHACMRVRCVFIVGKTEGPRGEGTAALSALAKLCALVSRVVTFSPWTDASPYTSAPQNPPTNNR